MGKIHIGAAAGLAVLGLAVAAADVNEFAQPSDIACLRNRGPDLGPPSGCNNGSQPHNRGTVVVTTLATANSTLTVSNGVMVTYAAEEHRLDNFGPTAISRSTSA